MSGVLGREFSNSLIEVNGEVNCNVNIKAVNDNVVSSNNEVASGYEFGQQNIKIKVYYPRHTFRPEIRRQVPSVNEGVYASNEKNSKYSFYDEATNTIFLGDGEYLSGTVSVNEEAEPYSNVYISKVTFQKSSSASSLTDGIKYDDKNGGEKTQAEHVFGTAPGTSYNSHNFTLYHDHEYSVYKYKKTASSVFTSVSSGVKNMYRLLIESDKAIEVRNETIKETSYVGDLVIEYANYAAGDNSSPAKYRIPVYVQVRNCPCTDSNDYYQALAE